MLVNEYNIWEEFEIGDIDFINCRGKYSKDFLEVYTGGFDLYEKGDWDKAKILFIKAQNKIGEIDYPIQKLLNLIEENNCKPPLNWKGARIIEEVNFC